MRCLPDSCLLCLDHLKWNRNVIVNFEPGDYGKYIFSVNDIGASEEIIWVLPTRVLFLQRFQCIPEELVAGNKPMTFWPQGKEYFGFQVMGWSNGGKIKTHKQSLGFRTKPPLKSSHPKKYLTNFPTPQKSQNRRLQTQKKPSIIPVTWNPEYFPHPPHPGFWLLWLVQILYH